MKKKTRCVLSIRAKKTKNATYLIVKTQEYEESFIFKMKRGHFNALKGKLDNFYNRMIEIRKEKPWPNFYNSFMLYMILHNLRHNMIGSGLSKDVNFTSKDFNEVNSYLEQYNFDESKELVRFIKLVQAYKEYTYLKGPEL